MSEWMSYSTAVELIGEESAKKFAELYGGQVVYIPQHPSEDDKIAQKIGMDALLSLSNRYGGIQIEVAKCSLNKKPFVIDLIDKDLSSREISVMAGVSSRYVRKIKAILRQAKI